MKEQSFFRTKVGGLTLAFIIIMIAFVLIIAGLGISSDILYIAGFIMIVAAMLYSPFKVFIIDKKRTKK